VVLAIICAAIGGWFSILCLSVFAHRSMAHRAVTLGPIPSHVMRFWLWFSTGTPTRRWVAVHRKHHVYTDVDGDPHSPFLYGLPRIFFLGYWYYRREAMKPETIEQYGKDTPNDWLERNVYEKHDNLGLILMLVADILIFGVGPGLVAYGVQIIWVSLWAAGFINGIGHAFGYRNWQTQDTSRNIMPIGIITSGEELHNNHHRWPRSAKFSMKWYEFDLGWAFIRAFAAVGQAKDIYVKNRRWRAAEIDDAPEATVTVPEALAKAREEIAKMPAKAQEAFANAKEELSKMPAKAQEAFANAKEAVAEMGEKPADTTAS
jgi:stearoyl-CoA desaturase (delta-9 desaturase)